MAATRYQAFVAAILLLMASLSTWLWIRSARLEARAAEIEMQRNDLVSSLEKGSHIPQVETANLPRIETPHQQSVEPPHVVNPALSVNAVPATQQSSQRRTGETNALPPERMAALLDGRELFNPGAIEESTIPVTEQTPLQIGQPLQVTWGGSWYAGKVVGFAEDGGVHVRYFGWAPSWDEIVPRAELRLDPQAFERAINASLPRLGAVQ